MSEVAKAAERLRELQGSELFSVEPDGDKRAIATRGIGVTWELWQKCKAVISWALPLLDSEPITEDWLLEVGFIRSDHPPSVYHELIEGRLIYWDKGIWRCEMRKKGDAWSESLSANNNMKTRGSVRMLCLSLGITLTEPSQP